MSIDFRITNLVTATENDIMRMRFRSSEYCSMLSPEGDIKSRIYVEAVKESAEAGK